MNVDPEGILRLGDTKVLLDDSINGNEESAVAATAISKNKNDSKKPNKSMMSDRLKIALVVARTALIESLS